MGMSVYAHLTFGLALSEDEWLYDECFSEDGLQEWLYECVPALTITMVGTYEYPTGYIISLGKEISADWEYMAVQINNLNIEPTDLEKYETLMKPLCRYLEIEYKEPKWYLSAITG